MHSTWVCKFIWCTHTTTTPPSSWRVGGCCYLSSLVCLLCTVQRLGLQNHQVHSHDNLAAFILAGGSLLRPLLQCLGGVHGTAPRLRLAVH